MLYDRPYEDRRKVRVTGPLTVESLSPHRIRFRSLCRPLVPIAPERGAARRVVKEVTPEFGRIPEKRFS